MSLVTCLSIALGAIIVTSELTKPDIQAWMNPELVLWSREMRPTRPCLSFRLDLPYHFIAMGSKGFPLGVVAKAFPHRERSDLKRRATSGIP